MEPRQTTGATRRDLLRLAGAALIARSPLFAYDKGIVPTMVEAAAKTKITVRPVRRNISVLEGSGGNIAVLRGKDGKVLVDAGFAVSRPAITDAFTSISSDPIHHLINTHWHADHTDGNAWLHSIGAAITAHENTRKRLIRPTKPLLPNDASSPYHCDSYAGGFFGSVLLPCAGLWLEAFPLS